MSVLVGRQAPDFLAPAVIASGVIVDRVHLHTCIRARYALLFFNPLGLTCPCSSEFSALDRRAEAFRQRDVEVLGVTLDAQYRHSIWRNIPVDYLPPIGYPLIVDTSRHICRDYGLALAGGGFACRGAFLIDPRGMVRYQAINDLALHGEIEHLVRMVDALQARDGQDTATTSGFGRNAGDQRPRLVSTVHEVDNA